MDPHYSQNRLPLSSLLAQYLTTHSRNPTSSPLELFLSIPSIDYSNIYCPSCSLPAPCLCTTVSNNLQASYLDFSPSNTDSPVNSTFNDFDISAYINTPEQSAHSTPSMTFSASAPSSPTRNDKPNGEKDEWSHVMRDRRRRSGVMSAEEARESASFLNTPEFKNASRKEKEELITRYQKRQQQNRNSQRNFRRRQAKLVEDLRGEIERLRSENERLMDEVLGLGRKGERKSDESGGGWKKKEKDVVGVRETSEEEYRDENEDSNGERE